MNKLWKIRCILHEYRVLRFFTMLFLGDLPPVAIFRETGLWKRDTQAVVENRKLLWKSPIFLPRRSCISGS